MAKTAAEKAPKAATVPKKAPATEKKKAEAPVAEGGDAAKVKKAKRRGAPSFASYIGAVLKASHPELSMSQKAKGVADCMTLDLFERLSQEAACVVRHKHSKTLSQKDVHAAVQILVPERLAIDALLRANAALELVEASKPPPAPKAAAKATKAAA